MRGWDDLAVSDGMNRCCGASLELMDSEQIPHFPRGIQRHSSRVPVKPSFGGLFVPHRLFPQ
jgi:hypothetical protein